MAKKISELNHKPYFSPNDLLVLVDSDGLETKQTQANALAGYWIAFSAAPGGTNNVQAGSWFRAIPAGPANDLARGPWS